MAGNFTLYVLHPTHTDVGYASTEKKAKSEHIAFIREDLDVLDKEPHFRWNCEAYRAVHEFLKIAEEGERDRFAKASSICCPTLTPTTGTTRLNASRWRFGEKRLLA